jgi:hypothetical protein
MGHHPVIEPEAQSQDGAGHRLGHHPAAAEATQDVLVVNAEILVRRLRA